MINASMERVVFRIGGANRGRHDPTHHRLQTLLPPVFGKMPCSEYLVDYEMRSNQQVTKKIPCKETKDQTISKARPSRVAFRNMLPNRT